MSVFPEEDPFNGQVSVQEENNVERERERGRVRKIREKERERISFVMSI